MSDSMIDRVARALASSESGDIEFYDKADVFTRGGFQRDARAAIEAMRDVSNVVLRAGFEAMFAADWNGTEAPMMGAGWEAMLTEALRDGGTAAIEK